ncbi:MAG: hypothetical protein RLZZ237_1174 [Pseudomonadota bacterium]
MKLKTVNLTKLASLSAAMLLAGCASTPPALQTVKVPVYVPCVASAPPRPAYEFERLSGAASDGELILTLARDWVSLRLYSLQLEAALQGCH